MTGDRQLQLVGKLTAEREAAQRHFNLALTRLDLALQALPAWPPPPPPFDSSQVARINDAWNILPSGPPATPQGIKGRLAAFVWRLVGPALQQQLAFNAALVDHLNRNVHVQQEENRALLELVPVVREGFEGLVRFESLLLQFLQQITPLVDTKERAVHHAIADLRTTAEIAQRASAMTRREIERLSASPAVAVTPAGAALESAEPAATGPRGPDAYKYVGFEDRFRGSEEEIRARVEAYVPYFEGASDVLDVGCGRGEFLALMKAKGVRTCGLDLNVEMVEVCRARGLEAVEGDALDYLSALEDESLGGLLAVQVVEHFEPDYLVRFLQTAFYKLRPGARIVLETINPACWVAFFESYIRDLTHVRPLHPETLQYLLQASGFAGVEIVYRSPVADKLQSVTPAPEHFGLDTGAPDRVLELAAAFNRNVERLNERMFTYQDYATVGRRP